MSQVFVDTSAVLALLSASDAMHARARRVFARLREREANLLTTSYVLVETHALLARRLGLGAVRSFREDLAPLLEVVWVDEPLHEEALDLLLARGRRGLSLVDAVSFVTLGRRRVEEAFAFDEHFAEEGYVLPS